MPTRYNDSRAKWIIDFVWQYPDGRKERIRKDAQIQTQKAADLEETQLKASILNGTYLTNTVVSPVFDNFVVDFLAKYSAVNNKQSEYDTKKSIIKSHLSPYLGSKRLSDIDAKAIESLKASLLARKLATKTVNNALICLARMLKIAEQWGCLSTVPKIQKLKLQEPQLTYFEVPQVEALLSVASPEIALLITIAVNCGLRASELCALQWRDIDLERRTITVCRSIYRGKLTTPKGLHSKQVPINDAVVAAIANATRDALFVFHYPDGSPFDRTKLYRELAKLCKLVGLSPCRVAHKLRHTFVSQLALLNVPMPVVKELARHANIQTTMRYCHLLPAHLTSAVADLGSLYATSQDNGKATEPATSKAISK